jgi:predicted glycoside hydrolase/deacetylase ChbG (UPF0249 family)
MPVTVEAIPMRKAIIFLAVLFFAGNLLGQSQNTAERLGYPRDAKLLIIHADDLAVAHSEDVASFDALDHNAVTSASIMIPCPWLDEVADYAKAHPDADLGLHLTLTSEWKTYHWGPVESKDKVPSLLDPSGYLWPDVPGAMHAFKADDVEREIRAQIERANAMGIHPTHLDSHMGTLYFRPDLLAVYVKVAHEYKLPFLAFVPEKTPTGVVPLPAPGTNDVLLDSLVIANPSVQPGDWKNFYANAIKNLKPGLTEIIVHLAHDDDEFRAISVDHPDYGAAWRQRDYDVVTSPEFKKLLADNHVILVRWKDLGKLLK